MTYNMVSNSGYHHTSLYSSKEYFDKENKVGHTLTSCSIDESVKIYKNSYGVEASQLILGAAFYGMKQTRSSINGEWKAAGTLSYTNIKNSYMNMTHYLQNYTFINRQDDLLNEYKGKKFQLKSVEENTMPDFNRDLMRQIMKLSSLTNETLFKVGMEDNGLYFYFGDEEKTIDNAKICVCKDYQEEFKNKGLMFNVNNLNLAFNSLYDQNIKIRYDGGTIVLSGDNDVSRKVIALVGKK